MSHEDQLARMYEIMARLAEIERERELILNRRERKAWQRINARSESALKAWETRRRNEAARRQAA